MKKSILFAISLTIILFTQNCTGGSLLTLYAPSTNTNPATDYATPAAYYRGGALFHKATYPGAIGSNAEAVNQGKGCNHAILALFSFGDSSIETAKKSANITKVAFVEYEQLGIFAGFLYHRVCTIVKGS
ncbi:TRL-like family protein [Leptospira yanagawae serovar Saopaulo str. Sao Paulo = ATCC 700523]|uniref:TRL-like family protein n=2 Tax=Leptospira yanagawae TaxID=293069 RepID=A0ABY2M265_9LEPT|nr:TRL-like family protein [Leptospira yanagawae]EOQ90579.1 TRL-like family protein [Leptospira yanagawae serovar Saopaulo str. Sao Paulo = ATCC 700523]TGL18999.1 TRL-like family protein [Leptospira yanagawae]